MAKGFVKISNDLFDFMVSGTLKGAELEVMWFLIRYSKGFNRSTTRASYSFIANGMNCSTDKVRRAVKKLIAKGYISVEYEAVGSKAQVFRIAYANLQMSYMQNSTYDVGQIAHKKVCKSAHQDITTDITNIYITKEDTNFTSKSWEELNAEDWED